MHPKSTTNSKTAVIILNRNTPDVADRLYSQLLSSESNILDVFIVESGTDPDKLSSNYSFYADWQDAMDYGLRYPRGMNFGLYNVITNHPNVYDSFLLMANDNVFHSNNPIEKLRRRLFSDNKIGLVSPCGVDWGEREILDHTDERSRAFWYIHNNCFLISNEMLNRISSIDTGWENLLFDGHNFRGYGSESELIAKGYINQLMSIIDASVLVSEDESLLKERYSLIKTEAEEVNFELYIKEGLNWMKNKYGFQSRWDMNNYALNAYCQFFDWHPSYVQPYSIL